MSREVQSFCLIVVVRLVTRWGGEGWCAELSARPFSKFGMYFKSRFQQIRVLLHKCVCGVVVNSDTVFHIRRPRQNLKFIVEMFTVL
jgi:hypothetical protein